MRRRTPVSVVLLTILTATLQLFGQRNEARRDESAVRAVVQQFEAGLQARDLKQIEAAVADDLVAFENGHRNDGWADFHDHHLLPEMKEPAPPTRTEFVRASAATDMAWAYTRSEMTLTRKSGEKVVARLWSIYVLEKRRGQWKIVLLDWSMHVPRPATAK
ncbi:MAG: DUF4440 domain-containing protein [Terriglobales bacterium]